MTRLCSARMQITLLGFIAYLSSYQCVTVKKSESTASKSSETENSITKNSKDALGKKGSPLPGPAILAIEIVDPEDPENNSTDARSNTKRTIESSLGYGYNTGNIPKPQFMFYKYSQHDIPAYSIGHHKSSQTVPKSQIASGSFGPHANAKAPLDIQKSITYNLGTQVSVVPQKPGVQTPPYLPPPTSSAAGHPTVPSVQHATGTTLFTTINPQGQLGTISPHLTYQNLGYNSPVVPVIIMRIYANQLANPHGAIYPNLPESDPYASLNNINIMDVVRGYLQQAFQNPQGVNLAAVNLHGAQSHTAPSAYIQPHTQSQSYHYRTPQYQRSLSQVYHYHAPQQVPYPADYIQQYQEPIYYIDSKGQYYYMPRQAIIPGDLSQVYSQPQYVESHYQQPQYIQGQYQQYQDQSYQQPQQYSVNQYQQPEYSQNDYQQSQTYSKKQHKYSSARLPTSENFPSTLHTRVVFHSNNNGHIPEKYSKSDNAPATSTVVTRGHVVLNSPQIDTSPFIPSSPPVVSRSYVDSSSAGVHPSAADSLQVAEHTSVAANSPAIVHSAVATNPSVVAGSPVFVSSSATATSPIVVSSPVFSSPVSTSSSKRRGKSSKTPTAIVDYSFEASGAPPSTLQQQKTYYQSPSYTSTDTYQKTLYTTPKDHQSSSYPSSKDYDQTGSYNSNYQQVQTETYNQLSRPTTYNTKNQNDYQSASYSPSKDYDQTGSYNSNYQQVQTETYNQKSRPTTYNSKNQKDYQSASYSPSKDYDQTGSYNSNYQQVQTETYNQKSRPTTYNSKNQKDYQSASYSPSKDYDQTGSYNSNYQPVQTETYSQQQNRPTIYTSKNYQGNGDYSYETPQYYKNVMEQFLQNVAQYSSGASSSKEIDKSSTSATNVAEIADNYQTRSETSVQSKSKKAGSGRNSSNYNKGYQPKRGSTSN